MPPWNSGGRPHVAAGVRTRISTPLLLVTIAACQPAPKSDETATPDEASTTAVCDVAELARETLAEDTRPAALIAIDLDTGEQVAAELHQLESNAAIPPASTVKPLLGAAALEHGLIEADQPLPCGGEWKRDGIELRCHADHGEIDLPTALATSCNAYFFEVAHRLGPERTAAQFERFGLTELAAAARNPDPAMALAAAIGHGGATVTPSALANAYVELAFQRTPALEGVHQGLREAVSAEHGTARAAAAQGTIVAGKTGTAEAENGHMHGWFVGYAPIESPRILTLAYVHGEGPASQTAAPVAGKFLSRWAAECSAP